MKITTQTIIITIPLQITIYQQTIIITLYGTLYIILNKKIKIKTKLINQKVSKNKNIKVDQPLTELINPKNFIKHYNMKTNTKIIISSSSKIKIIIYIINILYK